MIFSPCEKLQSKKILFYNRAGRVAKPGSSLVEGDEGL